MIFVVQAFYVYAKINLTPPNYMEYAHGFVGFYLVGVIWLIWECCMWLFNRVFRWNVIGIGPIMR